MSDKVKELRRIANEYRKHLEDYWCRDPFVGICRMASRELQTLLLKVGFDARLANGTYTDVEDGYVEKAITYGCLESKDVWEIERDWDNSWGHWWVEVMIDGELWVVDVTASQFHVSCPNEYRVVVTRKEQAFSYGSETVALAQRLHS
jgi:hypothetical protein